MMRLCVTAFAAILAGLPAFAQDFSPVQEKVTALGHGLYVLSGTGAPFAIGNTTVAVGSDGIILADSQFAPLHDKLRAAIAGLSPLPVRYLIDTHYHADHSGGNAPFRAEGVTVVAHDNVVQRMRHPPPGAGGQPGTPVPEAGQPNQPYSGNRSSLTVGGMTADLLHPPPSHTDGDSIVIFKAADVIATGDLVTSFSYPFIDVPVGGGIDGMIATADRIIALCGPNTRIVPGHGPITDKAGIIEYRAMLRTARDRIAKAKASGLSEQQMVEANLLADIDARWKPPGTTPNSARFPILVYRSIQ